MAQFTKYSSGDASGPGAILGQAGEVLRILDACLVNGYTGKTAAGWSKPIANSGNAGCYKQGGGSQYVLYINDATPDGTALGKEAWATGWKSITAVTTPVGTGTGQFPLPAQCLTNGHVVIRKSSTNDTTPRAWTVFADDRTVYLFIIPNEVVTGAYTDFAFGDFFSMWGNTDVNRCMIIGRNVANTASATVGNGGLARIMSPAINNSSINGSQCADNFSGTSGSIFIWACGDLSRINGDQATANGLTLSGSMPTPNPADNSYYLSPVWLMESTFAVRGRLRGLYQICHPIGSFTDGMTFSGSGDYAGKTFVVLVQGIPGGMYCIETSATLDTN